MKPISLSRHARNRMRLYEVSLEQVREVLAEPSLVTDSIRGRRNAHALVAGRSLRVTFVEEAEVIAVVTVIADVSTLEV